MSSLLNAFGTLLISSLLILSILAVRVLLGAFGLISHTSGTSSMQVMGSGYEDSLRIQVPTAGIISDPVPLFPTPSKELKKLAQEIKEAEEKGDYYHAFQSQQAYRILSDSLNSLPSSLREAPVPLPLGRLPKENQLALSQQLNGLWVGVGLAGLFVLFLSILIYRQERYRSELEALVHNRNARLRRKNRQLSRIQEELDQCIYIITHDLQQPITTIQSYVKLLQRKYQVRMNTEANQSLQRMQEASLWGNLLLRELLYEAKITQASDFEKVDLHELTCEVLTHLIRQISTCNATIGVGKNFPMVLSRKEEIRILIHQLIVAGLEHQVEWGNPYIDVAAWAGKEYWGITVECKEKELLTTKEIPYALQQGMNPAPYDKPWPEQTYGGVICEKIVAMNGGTIRTYEATGKAVKYEVQIPHGVEVAQPINHLLERSH